MSANGRINDPKTAPMVPVYVHINHTPPDTNVTILGWQRDTDKILEYTFEAKAFDSFLSRDPDAADIEWLRNIGART